MSNPKVRRLSDDTDEMRCESCGHVWEYTKLGVAVTCPSCGVLGRIRGPRATLKKRSRRIEVDWEP